MAPFISKAQRAWMYANKLEMAKQWEADTLKGKKLPERVGKTKMHKAKEKLKRAMARVKR